MLTSKTAMAVGEGPEAGAGGHQPVAIRHDRQHQKGRRCGYVVSGNGGLARSGCRSSSGRGRSGRRIRPLHAVGGFWPAASVPRGSDHVTWFAVRNAGSCVAGVRFWWTPATPVTLGPAFRTPRASSITVRSAPRLSSAAPRLSSAPPRLSSAPPRASATPAHQGRVRASGHRAGA